MSGYSLRMIWQRAESDNLRWPRQRVYLPPNLTIIAYQGCFVGWNEHYNFMWFLWNTNRVLLHIHWSTLTTDRCHDNEKNQWVGHIRQQLNILSSKLLEAGKMGKCQDLSDLDEGQILIAIEGGPRKTKLWTGDRVTDGQDSVMWGAKAGMCGPTQQTSYCRSDCWKSWCWFWTKAVTTHSAYIAESMPWGIRGVLAAKGRPVMADRCMSKNSSLQVSSAYSDLVKEY